MIKRGTPARKETLLMSGWGLWKGVGYSRWDGLNRCPSSIPEYGAGGLDSFFEFSKLLKTSQIESSLPRQETGDSGTVCRRVTGLTVANSTI